MKLWSIPLKVLFLNSSSKVIILIFLIRWRNVLAVVLVIHGWFHVHYILSLITHVPDSQATDRFFIIDRRSHIVTVLVYTSLVITWFVLSIYLVYCYSLIQFIYPIYVNLELNLFTWFHKANSRIIMLWRLINLVSWGQYQNNCALTFDKPGLYSDV